eukprot:scaffold378115_cov14-Prasinocladus_malaysianus.AAC.1
MSQSGTASIATYLDVEYIQSSSYIAGRTSRSGLKASASAATTSARHRTLALMTLEALRGSATAKRSQMAPAAARQRVLSAVSGLLRGPVRG